MNRARARRGVAVYLGSVAALTAATATVALRTRDRRWLRTVMMVPSVSAAIARLVNREGFADHRLGVPAAEDVRDAVVFPLVASVPAYAAAWASGVVRPVDGAVRELPGRIAATTARAVAVSWGRTLGEEWGWRGYLLPRLEEAGVPRPVLVTGLIWSAWHVPFIVAGMYVAEDDPVLVSAVFTATVLSLNDVICRIGRDSVWPAAVAHSVWNHVVQQVLDRATTGERAHRWVGESGVLVAASAAVAAVLQKRGRRRSGGAARYS